FENAGYSVSIAENATSALRLLQKETCDLVVIDLALSGVDGFALCKIIRAQPLTSKLPLIALSKNEVETEKLEAFAAGADDYVAKNATAEIVSRSGTHLRAAQRESALMGSNRELRFLADLGRGLLRTLEPEQLVRRVAGATFEATGAAMCA